MINAVERPGIWGRWVYLLRPCLFQNFFSPHHSQPEQQQRYIPRQLSQVNYRTQIFLQHKPTMTSRTSSASSISSNSSIPQQKQHRVSSFCIEKGKWYDCLRPTSRPYQGFGGMSTFNVMNNDDRAAGTSNSWTEEVHHRMK